MICEPPRIAAWLVNLFTTPENAESITGDLQEEYSSFAESFGAGFARRWYWRHAIKTVAHLFGTAFRDAPWSIAATVVGGFLFMKFVTGLPGKLLSVITDRYLMFWSTHFKAYVWVLNGLGFAHLVSMILVGCAVAAVAKSREMVCTITLAFVLSVLIAIPLVEWHFAGNLVWMLFLGSNPLLVILGGLIVRNHRFAGI